MPTAQDYFPPYDVYRRSNGSKRPHPDLQEEEVTKRTRFLTNNGSKQMGGLRPLKLQINPPQLFDRHPRAEQASQAAHSSTDFHLRETRPILEEFQAGWGTISHLVHAEFPIVFEKTIQCSGRPERLVTTSHPNLVNLLGFRKEDSNIHLIYESMVVSLAEILASPSPALRPYEIAALCAEVCG